MAQDDVVKRLQDEINTARKNLTRAAVIRKRMKEEARRLQREGADDTGE